MKKVNWQTIINNLLDLHKQYGECVNQNDDEKQKLIVMLNMLLKQYNKNYDDSLLLVRTNVEHDN